MDKNIGASVCLSMGLFGTLVFSMPGKIIALPVHYTGSKCPDFYFSMPGYEKGVYKENAREGAVEVGWSRKACQ
jgi:hypothetical protein